MSLVGLVCRKRILVALPVCGKRYRNYRAPLQKGSVGCGQGGQHTQPDFKINFEQQSMCAKRVVLTRHICGERRRDYGAHLRNRAYIYSYIHSVCGAQAGRTTTLIIKCEQQLKCVTWQPSQHTRFNAIPHTATHSNNVLK